MHKHTNALIHETSPYLLQHAHNPVNWMPWGPAAFAKAKAENKPIFLSVGYSTCYWCHVMERESFEHEDVAEIINEHFVPVKVDREERPEVDQQYMMATQLVTGRGGWPNSVWLTPEGKPWMAGTYFPREQFKQILLQLSDVWDNRHDDAVKQAEQFTSAIEKIGAGNVPSKPISTELITQTVETSLQRFDPEHGGFEDAPKFPPHANLALLIDQYRRDKNPRVLDAIETTLSEMGRGGVYDQLGGGFHRYSTDGRWLLPHFEKMLYDNGQLMRSYTDGYLLTKNERHRETVAGIYDWLVREMNSPEGGFYSAVDSESDAEEGKFYVWTFDEIISVLGDEDGKLFASVYGASPGGNIKEEATGHASKNNVLHLETTIETFAEKNSMDSRDLDKQLSAMRAKLLTVRQKREYPHLDDKVIAAWNGLMIEGLAYAGHQLDEPKYIETAKRAADFILDKMMNDGRLQRTYRSKTAKINGYLDDYAFVSAGLLELYRATDDEKYLTAAQGMADTVMRDFADEQNGGFYFTAEPQSGERAEFVIRSKNLGGGGNLPSGNGAMAQVLFDLGDLTDDDKYVDAARQTLEGLSGYMWQSAGQADHLLIAAATALDKADTASSVSSSDADATFEATAVEGEAYVSKVKLKPGESFQLAVQLNIKKGFHLYGTNEGIAFVKPTTITFAKSNVPVVEKMVPPSGITKLDKAIGQELQTYQDLVTFFADLKLPDDAEIGSLVLTFNVATQACNEKQCMAPGESTVEIPLLILPASESSVPPRHAEIFLKRDRLDAGK
ncbi:MAG: thioredoxin domain-containing protein [Planctomycetaceae bacterium]